MAYDPARVTELEARLRRQDYRARPVLLKWSRADEHGWEPYGAPGVVELEASLGVQGVGSPRPPAATELTVDGERRVGAAEAVLLPPRRRRGAWRSRS